MAGDVRDDAERVHPASAAAWGAWLAANHDRSQGVWMVRTRKSAGTPELTWDEAVAEALRFGWIDSLPRKLDERLTMLWFSPRRAGSAWSGLNKRRIAQLEAEGRMEPAGVAMVAAAKADGTWTLLDAAEALEVPDDLAAAFDERPGSRERWDAFPPSARSGILQWIAQAKRPATRARRVAETASEAAEGRRANQWPRA